MVRTPVSTSKFQVRFSPQVPLVGASARSIVSPGFTSCARTLPLPSQRANTVRAPSASTIQSRTRFTLFHFKLKCCPIIPLPLLCRLYLAFCDPANLIFRSDSFFTGLWNKLEAYDLIVSYIPVSNNTKDLICRASNMNRHTLSKLYCQCDCVTMYGVAS